MKNQQSIWERTKSLLVFYVFTDHDDFQLFRSSLDSVLIESNVRRLKVIIQVKDTKEVVLKHSLFSYISDNDLSYFGNTIKKKSVVEGQENIENIRDDEYDLFLCFGTPTKKILKWLAKVNSLKKVGVNTENYPLFDMNLQSAANSMGNYVNFTSEMLNKII